MTDRQRILPWLFFAASIGFTIVAIIFMLLNRPTPNLPDPFGHREIEPLGVLAFTTCGLLLTQRVPGNAVGWLFCIAGVLLALNAFLQGYTSYSTYTDPGSLPASRA